MASFGSDFGQKVDLTASIRNILRNYPEGTAVLKELIQNADDAGAQKVSFCLDCRTHPHTTLAHPDLQPFQGPALVVYNDAVFTEQDFQSIQRIGDSLKKFEDSKAKIGRFGIGFNAVYHWTDLPSFVSAEYLVMLDPQARFLPNINPANPGKIVNWVKDRNILATFHDQFEPYRGHGGLSFADGSPYQGTVFRLPLRSVDQAATSMLSKRSLSIQEATSLLHQLQHEASSLLLFLKNVESIELSIWSYGQTEPQVLSLCSIENVAPIRTLRSATLAQFKSVAAGGSTGSIVLADYSMRIRCYHRSVSTDTGDEEQVRYSELWEVCNQLGGTEASRIALDAANEHLRLVPWGGVAALLSSSAPARRILKAEESNGVAYCFLSLPVQTRLPVMCNGFFELSSNRRDVWQAGADMTGDGMTRAKWNLSLMGSVIAPCYVRLLQRAKHALGFSDAFQCLWPSGTVPSPWKSVVDAMLAEAANHALLYVRYEQADLTSFATMNPADSFSSVGANEVWVESQWVKCRDALFLPNSATAAESVSVHRRLLGSLLLAMEKPLVQCVASLQALLLDSGTSRQVADAKFVRDALRNSTLSRSKQRQFLSKAERIRPGFLSYFISFCCEDLLLDSMLLSLNDPTAILDSKQMRLFAELNSLPLLPLMNSEVGELRVYSKEQQSALIQLESMGFSSVRAVSALSQVDFQLDRALDLLTASSTNSSDATLSDANLVLLCSDAEASLFSAASGVLLDPSRIGPRELKFLTHVRVQPACNVRSFTASYLNDVLLRVLPPVCASIRSISAANLTGNGFEEFKLFLKSLWAYLVGKPSMIAALSDSLAVLPVVATKFSGTAVSTSESQIVPFSLTSNALASTKGDVVLPDSIRKVIEDTGIQLVDSGIIPQIASMPESFWQRVHSPSRSGILQALYSLTIAESSGAGTSNASAYGLGALTSESRDALRLYLGTCESLRSLSHRDINLFRALPLFKLFGRTSSDNAVSDYISLNVAHKALANMSRIAEELMPTNYMKYLTPQDLSLLEALQVMVVKRSDFFVKELLPNATQLAKSFPVQYSNACVLMLSELSSLSVEKSDFVDVLRSSAFIPNRNTAVDDGSSETALHRPCDLFDPTDDELRALLDPRFFPSDSFCTPDGLVCLRSLGLQTSIEWPGVVACAEFIAGIDGNSSPEALEVKRSRGLALLQFLQKHIARLTTEKEKVPSIQSAAVLSFKMFSNLKTLFLDTKDDNSDSQSQGGVSDLTMEQYIQKLVTLAWLPVMAKPSTEYMPWLVGRSQDNSISVGAPCKSRPLRDIWFCSASFHVCEESVTSEKLQQIFGWAKPVPLKAVAIQLSEIANKYAEFSKNGTDTDSLMRQQITTLIPQMYQRLSECTAEDSIEIRSVLETVAWIWVGDRFVTVSAVAATTSINASPYLHQLPQDLRVYPKLLSLFQVKKAFSARDYAHVLKQMAAEYNGATLPDSSVDLAVSLAALVSTETGVDPHNVDVFLPDSNGKLVKSTELTNDDVPWLSGPEYASFRKGCRILHPNISSVVADKLGVKSLRLSQLSSTVNQSLFASAGEASANIEAFGQSESITNRLRTILDLYPDGSPIFSELIQNADDAGASVVRFLVDDCTYGSESLMDPKMASLQGPSLLVYNNAVFTEADFRNLARIGQASKIEKLATTGRFGLGFSSAYHITDTPSFVSGEHMVIFDPHCAYVPGANKNQPGLRVKFVGNMLTTLFKDQFQPFQFFGCDFTAAYQGTLFRFPLRTASLARRSEISKRAYTVEEMTGNLESLAKYFSNYLLFLRSVRSIEIYSRDSVSGDISLLHSASASRRDTKFVNDQFLMKFFEKNRQSESDASSENLSRDDFYMKLFNTPDSKLPSAVSHVSINIQSFALSNATKQSTQISGLDVSDEVDNHHVQSSALQRTSEIDFVIVSGLRGGEAKRMACSSTLRHLKLVPLGSVAACLRRKVTSHIDSQDSTEEFFPSLSGQVFCFLPLPINTQLPVHMNAYWELSSNRRDIWVGEDTTGEAKLRSDWNKAIMTDVLAPLYADLIVFVSKLQPSNSSSCRQMLSLLPCPIPNTHWRSTATALFPLIKQQKLLYSNLQGGVTLTLEQSYLMETYDEDKDAHSKRLETLLLLEQIPIVTVSSDIMKALVNSESVAGVISPMLICSYFNGAVPTISMRYDTTRRKKIDFASIKVGDSLTRDEMISNAIFLLDFCVQDIKPIEYGELQNVPLVPLEDGSLGCIGSSIDPPLFVASEAERKLLTGSKAHLVVCDTQLGPTVASLFKSTEFHANSNIRPLSTIDVLRLLKSTVPLDWFAETCTVVDYEGVVSTDWLLSLWAYVLETKCLPIYKDTLPMLPVLSSASGERKKSSAVKMLNTVPVMAHTDMPPELINALITLGVYVFDSTTLGRYAYEDEVVAHLLPQSGRGFLQAFQKVGVSKLAEASSIWTPPTRDLFREFVLDSIVDKSDSISPADQSLLQSLCIWKTNESTNQSATYGALCNSEDTKEKLLPPKGIDIALLTDTYVSVRGDQDRKLYRLIGLKAEQSRAEFYMQHFIPHATAGAYSNSLVDTTVANLITHCSLYEAECEGFKECLGASQLFRNAAGNLVTASQLFDPEIPSFIALLPKSMFPASFLAKYPSTLHMLRSLGMNSKMSGEGVLRAAKAVQEDLIAVTSTGNLDLLDDRAELEMTEKLNSIRKRSVELLAYIDSHVEDILESVDPEGLAIMRVKMLKGESLVDAMVGGDWGSDLRSIQWVSCHTAKPIATYEHKTLPWPDSVHKHMFAAPSQCATIEQLWLCSQSRRIAASNVKSELARALLGWNKRVSGRTLALQMTKLKELYDEIISAVPPTEESSLMPFYQLYQSISLKYLEVLSGCLRTESESEVAVWLQALSGRAYLWIDNKFLEADKVAFSAPSNISLEPYFYLVPVQYQIYGDLLRTLGVKESFNPVDMMKTVAELHKVSPNKPLPPSKHRMCVGVLKFVAKILIEQSRETTKSPVTEVVGQVVEGSADSATPVILGTAVDSNTAASLVDISDEDTSAPQSFTLSLADLGEIFIPSDGCVLYKASALTFDDAPWVSASIRKPSGRSTSSIVFVCSELVEEEAAALGVKSLRKQLFAGDEIICPDVSALRQMMAGDTFVDLLKDILVLADGVLRAKSVHVAFDQRQYATESLMNPGLCAAQGPAVVLCIDGPVLSSEAISQFLATPMQLQGINQAAGVAPTVESELRMYPKGGKRLVSSFALTDCLKIISGTQFFIFDPTGEVLFQDSAIKLKGVSSSKAKRGKAQKTNLVGRGDEDGLYKRFPDQFAPFVSLPFGLSAETLSSGFQGIMIRLPLRLKSSAISENVVSLDDVKFGLRTFKQLAECSLLMGSSLTSVSCYHCSADDNNATLDYQVTLASNPVLRYSRYELLTNTQYKKSGLLSSMFSAPFTPPQSIYKLALATKMNFAATTAVSNTSSGVNKVGWLEWDAGCCKKFEPRPRAGADVPSHPGTSSAPLSQVVDEYLLLSSLGEGKCRDEACKEPLLSFELRPFLTVAFRLLRDWELGDASTAPDVGYLCSGANPLMPSGLPCHIEAPFLENTWERCVPFLRAKDGAMQESSSVGGSNVLPSRKLKLSRPGTSSLLTTIDVQTWNVSLFQTAVELIVPRMLHELMHSFPSAAAKMGFYKYWPYLGRAHADLTQLMVMSNLHSHLSNTSLFLTRNGFDRIESAILPIEPLRPDILQLLYKLLTLAQTPPELARDLLQSKKVKPKVLYPTRLRELLRTSGADLLKQRPNMPSMSFEMAWALLAYCLTDLPSISSAAENEYHARRVYKELAGCPLLPMADGSVRCFPKSAREQVFKLPPALHAILPSMVPSAVHLKIDSFSPLIGNIMFLESLSISQNCVDVVSEIVPKAFPQSWRRCDAVTGWAKPETRRGFVGRGINPNSGPALEVLLHVLWKELLHSQDMTTFRAFGDWPLVPVTSGRRKLLLQPQYLPFVFASPSTPQAEAERDQIRRELGRLTSIVTTGAEAQLKQALQQNASQDTEWAWIHDRVESDRGSLKPTPSGTVADSADDHLPRAVPVSASELTYASTSEEPAVAEIQLQGEMQIEDAIVEPGRREADTVSLFNILRKLGVPFIDPEVLESAPAILNFEAMPIANRPSTARRILNSLSCFTQRGVTVYKHTEGENVTPDGELLQHESLSVQERADLLEQIYLDHQLAPLSAAEIAQLKTLRLFTQQTSQRTEQTSSSFTQLLGGSGSSSSREPAVAISDYKTGAYWCSSAHTFDGISILTYASDASADSGNNSGPSTMPAVLIDEARLRPLYALLGVQELTPALAARQFILPGLLGTATSVSKKSELMQNFAQNWDLYKTDRELVESLKEVHFVPSWRSGETEDDDSDSLIGRNPAPGPLRKASQCLAWDDEDLVAVLRGRLECRYFPPPSMRSPELLAMMTDIGTPKEVTRDDIIRIALDIESIHKQGVATAGSEEVSSSQEAADYGRRLLRYIRDDARSAALFNRTFGSRLSKIQFVPARVPVRVEHGGFVVYEQRLCCLNQLASKQCGSLVFCVKPVIEDDISLLPHLYSWLSVTTDPSLETVMSHLMKLTEQSDSIDRWNNAQFTPEATFNALFTYLYDHWKDISPDKKTALKASAIIPLGHQLVPASRLFFKLAENLAPFMHEIPRALGVHEEFLKLLGVRESPSVDDYTRFLSALAAECGTLSLNPNELRAVVTIIESIASLREDDQVDEQFVTPKISEGLFLPDTASILRPCVSCVVNNDSWLKAQASSMLESMNLFVVHPWLPPSAIKALQLPPISSVVKEVLTLNNEALQQLFVDEDKEVMLQRYVRNVLSSEAVVKGLVELALTANTMSVVSVEDIHSKLTNVLFRFVRALPTTFAPAANGPSHVTSTAAVHSQHDTRLTSETFDPLSSSLPPPASSTSESLYFVQHALSEVEGRCVVFVNLSTLQPPLTLLTAVAAAVCELLTMPPLITATAAYLLTSAAYTHMENPNQHEVDAFVATIATASPHTHVYQNAEESAQSQSVLARLRLASDPAMMSERLRGAPGERVSSYTRDVAALELKPFRLFQVGEIVAFSANAASTNALVLGISGSDDLRYGKVLSVGEVDESGIRRLQVRTGPASSQQFLSTDVYSFKTTRDSKRQTQSAARQFQSPFSLFNRLQSPSNTTSSVAKEASSVATTTPATFDPSDLNAPQPIQQVEVLDALKSLLARAGLSPDLNTQDLMQRTLELSASLRRTEKDLQDERLVLTETKARLERASGALICQICQEQRVRQVLVPCGHILCVSCCEQLRGRKCPFCRQGYSQSVNFYPPSEMDTDS